VCLIADVSKVKVDVLLLHGDLPARLGVYDLALDFRSHRIVLLLLHKLDDGLFLLRSDVLLVPKIRRKHTKQTTVSTTAQEAEKRERKRSPLNENKERLVPEHGHLPLLVLEADEVEHEGVNHTEGECVLLVQEDADEEAVDSRILHLHDLEQRGARVQHGDADLGDHTANDGCLAEGAISGLTDWEEETLEEGCRLVEGLLDGHVEVVVDLLGLAEVISHPRQQHEIEEAEGERNEDVQQWANSKQQMNKEADRCAILTLRLEAKILVAWNIAW